MKTLRIHCAWLVLAMLVTCLASAGCDGEGGAPGGAPGNGEGTAGGGAVGGATPPVDQPAGGGGGPPGGGGAGGAAPVFSLAWSEYPSWSVFGVAHEQGLIDGGEGRMGPLEQKWGVDIVLHQADYDTTITMYISGRADAVCITNMDALNPALGRDSVAVLPTSTSVGADACVVVGINSVKELRDYKVYGLEKSVSEYCFVRNLELAGEKEEDHRFTNMDPGAAAQAMQTNQPGYEAIMVWNPFVLQTLQTRPDAKVLFDSSGIPGEIIDMVVVARASLREPGGDAFACAVIDTYYQLNRMLADPQTGDETLVALGAKFSSLGLEEMKKVVEQTRFYKTPEEALAVYEGKDLPELMRRVVSFCLEHEIVPEEPTLAFSGGDGSGGGGTDDGAGGGADAQLRFDTSYIRRVQDRDRR